MSSVCVFRVQIMRMASVHGGVVGMHLATYLAVACITHASDQAWPLVVGFINIPVTSRVNRVRGTGVESI